MPITRRAMLALPLFLAIRPATAQEPLSWLPAVKRGEVVALLRHALAPGTGDPEGFRLGDCSTQRNLSPAGRDQARAIGARLRDIGLEKAGVFSSQWCRCLDTARLLDLGEVKELPALNSFFADPGRRSVQTRELDTWLAAQTSAKPRILVTHQVNITALTGIVPASGELVIVSRLSGASPRLVGTARLA
ncbi:histidine phosphatase family protein [Pannonibacter carbonis]|uniref:histidine phosphatase family protein n=1 Tax=Pannonibacter carbonis TaxID=2067569 RepID=UPI000D0F41F9|nr:histidine phosphatase family protein [Pannonibacter carbonis]